MSILLKVFPELYIVWLIPVQSGTWEHVFSPRHGLIKTKIFFVSCYSMVSKLEVSALSQACRLMATLMIKKPHINQECCPSNINKQWWAAYQTWGEKFSNLHSGYVKVRRARINLWLGPCYFITDSFHCWKKTWHVHSPGLLPLFGGEKKLSGAEFVQNGKLAASWVLGLKGWASTRKCSSEKCVWAINVQLNHFRWQPHAVRKWWKQAMKVPDV